LLAVFQIKAYENLCMLGEWGTDVKVRNQARKPKGMKRNVSFTISSSHFPQKSNQTFFFFQFLIYFIENFSFDLYFLLNFSPLFNLFWTWTWTLWCAVSFGWLQFQGPIPCILSCVDRHKVPWFAYKERISYRALDDKFQINESINSKQ